MRYNKSLQLASRPERSAVLSIYKATYFIKAIKMNRMKIDRRLVNIQDHQHVLEDAYLLKHHKQSYEP